jgi:hypothetical protein
MSDPNSVLSVWQLTLMAVVPTMFLVGWVITVFLAAREPRVRNVATASRPAVIGAGTQDAGTQDASGQDASGQDAAGQEEPVRADRRLAA